MLCIVSWHNRSIFSWFFSWWDRHFRQRLFITGNVWFDVFISLRQFVKHLHKVIYLFWEDMKRTRHRFFILQPYSIGEFEIYLSHHEQQMNERKRKQSPVAVILSSHDATTNKARELFKPSDDVECPPVTIEKIGKIWNWFCCGKSILGLGLGFLDPHYRTLGSSPEGQFVSFFKKS